MSSTPKIYNPEALNLEGNVVEQENPFSTPPPTSPDKTLVVQQTQQIHSGPIPSPTVLREYEAIKEGAADRIISMAEREAAHRHHMESTALDANIEAGKRKHTEIRAGQKFGLISTLTGFAVAALAIILGHEKVAAIICSVVIVTLAAVFITGKYGVGYKLPSTENDNTAPEEETQDQ